MSIKFRAILIAPIMLVVPNICINTFVFSTYVQQGKNINLVQFFTSLTFTLSCVVQIFMLFWYGNEVTHYVS